MKIHAFGDSFVVGDQDDFTHELPADISPSHNQSYDERLEYLKYNVSFAALVARYLGFGFSNHAVRGSGNYPQLDKLWHQLATKNIKQNDLVFFGITTLSRDRQQALYLEKAVNNGFGECLVDRELLVQKKPEELCWIDYFYILSVLEQLGKTFNVKIIKFNLFDNPLDYASEDVSKLYGFSDLVGWDLKGNTLIDVINDTWGQNVPHTYHNLIQVPAGYECYYTRNKHPSIEGHIKIANWIIKNVNFRK